MNAPRRSYTPNNEERTERRAFVRRASTYRSREREPDCALCGEWIREWESFTMYEHPSFGGVALPVHDECVP